MAPISILLMLIPNVKTNALYYQSRNSLYELSDEELIVAESPIQNSAKNVRREMVFLFTLLYKLFLHTFTTIL